MRQFKVARLRLWWEGAFWVIPVAGVVLGIVVHGMAASVDELLVLPGTLPPTISASSASQLLGAIGSGMVTFTGFVFSFVILLLQFGSSQYSPRTVSYFLRARSTQVILAIFLATITFAFVGMLDVGAYGRDEYAPITTILVSTLLLFASLAAFILLLHSVGGRMSVDAVLAAMGRQAREQLPKRVSSTVGGATVGPVREASETAGGEPTKSGSHASDAAAGVVVRSRESGQLVAIDSRRLLRVASRHGLMVTVLIQVGDSVTTGSPVMRVRSAGGGPVPPGVEVPLRRGVVVDQERSLRYDPFYSLRLLVDIGIRALSPGINDPTTAVRALDEIEDVLRVAAVQQLGVRRLRSDTGDIVVPAPDWADVVMLALLEFLIFGSGQPQVARRLMALIDDLVADLPQARDVPLLELREELLARIKSQGMGPRLTSIVSRRDRQGLGGPLDG